ncbi:hypothetical protein OKW21_001562 [Catalinimonas alkaloidigena]|uniref:hypothetical protein n=1 Tax=Catalinimonas alkaloidigena TaxID=1075417 RepID=UPI002406F215|nr:hypothetical protein [Catalinimonas alkaloidigena]MDF9796299.1 hypothetical protein [Catalinimonas alkaloidigena]
MKKSITDNLYKEGQAVCAINAPLERLVIRRYVDRIYYCMFLDDPERKELALFERELTSKVPKLKA